MTTTPKHQTSAESDAWERPPRPVFGWLVFAVCLLARVWTLPIVVVGMLVSAVAEAAMLGYVIVRDDEGFAWARRLRDGRRRPRERKTPRPVCVSGCCDDDNLDDFDDDDDT